mmetsp:Transcript_37023/g.97042  ORF Transcript_37023/g.97042 Transcript_37023/m.97042 type:complete len:308 (+) Transcript_37023:1511-2434(+)
MSDLDGRDPTRVSLLHLALSEIGVPLSVLLLERLELPVPILLLPHLPRMRIGFVLILLVFVDGAPSQRIPRPAKRLVDRLQGRERVWKSGLVGAVLNEEIVFLHVVEFERVFNVVGKCFGHHGDEQIDEHNVGHEEVDPGQHRHRLLERVAAVAKRRRAEALRLLLEVFQHELPKDLKIRPKCDLAPRSRCRRAEERNAVRVQDGRLSRAIAQPHDHKEGHKRDEVGLHFQDGDNLRSDVARDEVKSQAATHQRNEANGGHELCCANGDPAVVVHAPAPQPKAQPEQRVDNGIQDVPVLLEPVEEAR